ncbi:undecaprenyldiphospho-muramoylpentapeptide beta-N-acetylglucosaminyltransferase [Marinobacterium sp. AK62]|uniref:UDP-N-acetylglucosamine--N-acetylmuramyl-(pentapeptide) pyrophosphoryl-undecaprenol N-acetylglucosamine transferase n=1 Tax=Marinobacterium alkalitolerans TaxID=1542925 RepID=A0ABS3Z739_9GAMM|nr:undecaprenyldiphospho-muramoylpentapeptide beta-N-acetylglucosaminyltransferase [Marinobacterium alkalitolerans]MBP0047531.1 undecaprenyldiphospho-muramoylpentapeptide beta-N-acetylglucosaminyltransferase [Marinobacterium alkalitolerans]
MTQAKRKVLIMAGGTGGHVFPALATAEKLQQQGVEVEWLGSMKGIENELVPKAGIPLYRISITGLRGKGRLSLLLAPFRLARALGQALGVLHRAKPDAVLGMGGFASGPGGLAAWLCRVPVVVHEQNAIPGMTNRTLARLARRVLQAFPQAFEGRTGVETTGNPVRGPILNLAPPAERYAGREGPIRLLVVGGSLGALAINRILPQALARIPEEVRPQVWHQTGRQHLEATQSAYAEAGIEASVVPFIDRMDRAYEWADLVLCRAGALTVSEIEIAGLPAVFVPFPHAVDDHQTANARHMEQQGAARLIQQSELDAERLATVLTELNNRNELLMMAERAREQARPDAGDRVAQVCLEVMK